MKAIILTIGYWRDNTPNVTIPREVEGTPEEIINGITGGNWPEHASSVRSGTKAFDWGTPTLSNRIFTIHEAVRKLKAGNSIFLGLTNSKRWCLLTPIKDS